MELRRARPLLGTLVEIRADGAARTLLERAISTAFARIELIQARMSFHDVHSELTRINRQAHRSPVAVSADTWAVLAAAMRLSVRSGGVFDISIGARLVDAGFLPPHVDCDNRGDYRDIVLLPSRRVQFLRPLCIDLGGIAKGYAVDAAVTTLKRAGVTAGCVNAGGDLRVFGAHQHSVYVRHPDAPAQLMHLTELENCAVATSAGYYSKRATDDGWQTPIVDPRSGDCAITRASVSVACKQATYADALTKLVVLGGDAARDILQRYRARAFVVQAETTSTPTRLPYYELQPST